MAALAFAHLRFPIAKIGRKIIFMSNYNLCLRIHLLIFARTPISCDLRNTGCSSSTKGLTRGILASACPYDRSEDRAVESSQIPFGGPFSYSVSLKGCDNTLLVCTYN
jgi:hypothetical protein